MADYNLGLDALGSFTKGSGIANQIIENRLHQQQLNQNYDIQNRQITLQEQAALREAEQQRAFQQLAQEAYKQPELILPQLYARDPQAAAKISEGIQQQYSSQYNTLKLLTGTKAENKQATYNLLKPELERQFPELKFGDTYSTELNKSLNARADIIQSKIKTNLELRDTAQGIAAFNPQTGEASLTGFQPYRKPAEGAEGGATGALVKQVIKDNPGMNFTQALQLVQTGFRTGTRIDKEGNVEVIPGAPDAKKEIKSAESEGATFGKETGEKKALLRSMEAKIPELESTVTQLSKLGKLATYTTTGKVANEARKQLGLPTSEGAISRAEYISVVDNQVLPLLRDTFGAQFTEREGQTLRATLGDPDKTPTEKDAALKAFIKQKKQTIGSLSREVGKPQETKKQSYSEEDINHTAQKYGITPEEVKRRLNK